MLFVVGRVVAGLLASIVLVATARAETCRIAQMTMTPAVDAQTVVWLEAANGTFLQTLYITQATGTYGIANRPGLLEHNSAWRWPYGRRVNVFPVWSHRRNVEVPEVVFRETYCAQIGTEPGLCSGTETEQEFDLSHPIGQSSREPYFCRPLDLDEQKDVDMIDALSCATPVYTDKGALHPTRTSLYPPRNDLVIDEARDHPDVEMFAELNDLDAVSRATPAPGEPFSLNTLLPPTLAAGQYVLWVEVSAESDMNAWYQPECSEQQAAAGCRAFPMPDATVIPNWRQYGAAWRGQPSVLWKIVFEVPVSGETTQQALDYQGYGDPDGLDGTVRAPDQTIDTNVVGSGAQRLLVQSGAAGDNRVALRVSVDQDESPPAAPEVLGAMVAQDTQATLTFVAPADDGADAASGAVTEYEIRLLVGQEMTETNFDSGLLVAAPVPMAPGSEQTVELTGLLPQTGYSVGLRAKDNCLNDGALRVVSFQTTRSEGGEVDPVGCCQIGPRGTLPPLSGSLAILGLCAGLFGFSRRRRAH